MASWLADNVVTFSFGVPWESWLEEELPCGPERTQNMNTHKGNHLQSFHKQTASNFPSRFTHSECSVSSLFFSVFIEQLTMSVFFSFSLEMFALFGGINKLIKSCWVTKCWVLLFTQEWKWLVLFSNPIKIVSFTSLMWFPSLSSPPWQGGFEYMYNFLPYLLPVCLLWHLLALKGWRNHNRLHQIQFAPQPTCNNWNIFQTLPSGKDQHELSSFIYRLLSNNWQYLHLGHVFFI